MNKNRLIATVALIAVAPALLVGCGQSNDAPKDEPKAVTSLTPTTQLPTAEVDPDKELNRKWDKREVAVGLENDVRRLVTLLEDRLASEGQYPDPMALQMSDDIEFSPLVMVGSFDNVDDNFKVCLVHVPTDAWHSYDSSTATEASGDKGGCLDAR